MIIGLDFDGTIANHEYPEIGEDLGAFPYLHQAQAEGVEFILFTMRDGAELKAARDYMTSHGIALLACNVNPTQHMWTMSPKAYCHLYVDDNGLGIPLKDGDPRPAVDWAVAGPLLLDAVRRWYGRPHARG